MHILLLTAQGKSSLPNLWLLNKVSTLIKSSLALGGLSSVIKWVESESWIITIYSLFFQFLMSTQKAW